MVADATCVILIHFFTLISDITVYRLWFQTVTLVLFHRERPTYSKSSKVCTVHKILPFDADWLNNLLQSAADWSDDKCPEWAPRRSTANQQRLPVCHWQPAQKTHSPHETPDLWLVCLSAFLTQVHGLLKIIIDFLCS